MNNNTNITLDPREIEFYNAMDIVPLGNLLLNGDDMFIANNLMDFYMESNLMPYGVAKARDGDPYEWITERVDAYIKSLLVE